MHTSLEECYHVCSEVTQHREQHLRRMATQMAKNRVGFNQGGVSNLQSSESSPEAAAAAAAAALLEAAAAAAAAEEPSAARHNNQFSVL